MPEIYTFGPKDRENVEKVSIAPARRVASPSRVIEVNPRFITNKTSCILSIWVLRCFSDHNISLGKHIVMNSIENKNKNCLRPRP